VDDFLSSLSQSLGPADSQQLTVRELLGHWGARRRGAVIISQISSDLAEAGFATVPPFQDVMWIDETVSLVRRHGDSAPPPHVADLTTGSSAELADSGVLRVQSIKSAHGPLVSVGPQDSLGQAQGRMLQHDYSQLPILSGRDLRGVVSWESIAKALVVSPDCSLEDVKAPIDPPLRLEDDLLSNVSRIVEQGFLFVEGPDRHISGIITVADIAEEFENRAKPFFLLGDIERRLRRLVGRIPQELTPADTPISPEDMTFGQYQRLFERAEVWDSFQWKLDRPWFVKRIDAVRQIRNDVMHFSSDPFTDEEALELRHFVKTLQVLDPSA
jgi:predicted transcriptional regulator